MTFPSIEPYDSITAINMFNMNNRPPSLPQARYSYDAKVPIDVSALIAMVLRISPPGPVLDPCLKASLS